MKSTCILLVSALAFVSCKESNPSASAKPTEPSAAVLEILSAAPKGDAQSIHAARTSVKPGDEVTLTGRIMGNASPFVSGRSAFLLGDPEVLTACSDKPGDDCDTPWDNCCNTAEEKKVGLATIQITGADGRVLAEPLEGIGGLAKLATVTVSGRVAEGSSSDLLIINATAITAEE